MQIEWQIGFWIGAFLLLALLLWLFSGVLLPFAAAVAIGYLLNPLADWLERLGFNRLSATLLSLACCALVIVLIAVLILPVLWRQLASFIEALPTYATKLEELVSRLSQDYGGVLMNKLGLSNKGGELASATHDLVAQAAQWAASFLNSLLTGGAALISLVSLLFVTPVVVFYMLLDWDKMLMTIDGLVPLRHRETVRELAHEIDSGAGEEYRNL